MPTNIFKKTKTGQSRTVNKAAVSMLRPFCKCNAATAAYISYTIVTHINICTNQQNSKEFRWYEGYGKHSSSEGQMHTIRTSDVKNLAQRCRSDR
jgi:hypothetical protein